MPYSWTGFYVGAQVGGAWNDSRWSPLSAPGFDPFNTNGSGVVYGGQIGYNYQINRFVIGIEGDFAGSAAKGDSRRMPTAMTKSRWGRRTHLVNPTRATME